MTTPPLDLPALRARTHSVVDWFVSSDTVRALLDRLESAEKAVARVESYRDRLEAQDEQARYYAKGIQKALDGVPNA